MERDLGIKISKAIAAGGIALGGLAMTPTVSEASVVTNDQDHVVTVTDSTKEEYAFAIGIPIVIGLVGFALIIANSGRPPETK